MPITRSVYNTEELLGVYRDLIPIQDFWLKFFPGLYLSQSERIEWSKITNSRHLAPLVLPTAQGRPTYKADEDLYSIKPGYLKPKDTVQDASMEVRRAGLGELGQTRALSPNERYMATLASILQKHRGDVERRWEWMAAQAIQHGQVVLEDDGYPKATVSFNRDSGQTIVLAAGSRWGDSGVNTVDNLDSWMDTMSSADFGAMPRYCVMGTSAWRQFRDGAKVQTLLRNDLRNTSGTSLDLGPGSGAKVQYKGNITQDLEIWVYNDYYHTAAGVVTPMMDKRDVVLIGDPDSVGGVKAYGAILDKKASFQSLPFFPKMWDDDDPSATIVMSQSAPIMVPVNPNATMRIRVVNV